MNRWKEATLALAALAVVGALTAASTRQDVVEAKEFLLRGPDGTVRAALTVRDDGTPGLALFDRQGKPRLSLDMSATDHPRVNLHDAAGQLQAALAVRADGTPGLALFSATSPGAPRVSMDVGKDGSSGVNVYGPSGTLRAAIAIRADGTPAVGLFDEKGRIRRSIETAR